MKRVVFLIMVLGLIGMILTGCNNHHREEVVVASTPVATVSEEYASEESEDDLQTDKYVDLGLSSGTKWSNTNVEGFYEFEDALYLFGSNMPSKEQLEELKSECQWTWEKGESEKTTGMRVTGPNGKSIFLPAAGYRDVTEVLNVGKGGYYWSSTYYDGSYAYSMDFFVDYIFVNYYHRHYGLSVRLVRD